MTVRVHVLTNLPTYYQVDLFDAVSRLGELDLFVTYLRGMSPGRQWTRMPAPAHPHRKMPVRWAARPYFYNPGLVRHLRAVEADLLVVTQYSALSYQLAMVRAGLTRSPFVFWAEAAGVRFFEVKSSLPGPIGDLARWAAQRPVRAFAREVWAIGQRAVEQYGEVARCPVRRMPYVSDLTRFSRRDSPLAPDGRVRLLFAGKLSYRKGFDAVMEAARRLRGDARLAGRWSLSVCGDGDLRGAMAGLPGIEYLGFKEMDEMPAVMAGHDVFLAPSRYDGWGMVVPEALAAGMTVISTKETGSAVEIGEHPFLRFVNPEDAGELTACLEELISAPERVRANAPAAVAAAMEFDAAAGARRFSALARAALEGGCGA